jgi:hypothetical protein
MSEKIPSTNLSSSNMVGIFPVSFNDTNAAFQGHLINEQNLCKVIYQSSDKDHTSFVISYDHPSSDIYMLKFVSLGHYFECNMKDIVTAKDSWNDIYANIKVKTDGTMSPDINNDEPEGDETTLPATKKEEAVGNEETTITYCVVFTNSLPLASAKYSASLHVLTKVPKTNPVIYSVPTDSVERFNFNTIQTTDTFLVCGDSKIFSSNSTTKS